jgi:hypothetical protein
MTLPAASLQQQFAEFKYDCILEPSTVAIQLLDDLTVAAGNWYDCEDVRRDELIHVISKSTNISPRTEAIGLNDFLHRVGVPDVETRCS